MRQTMIAVLLLLTWGGFKSLSFAQYQSQRRFATASNGTNHETQSIRLPGFVIHSPTSAEQMRKRLDTIIDSEPRLKTSPRVAIVNFSCYRQARFFVYDSRARTVLYSTYVGHSSYSGEDIPTKFSNVPQSKDILGLYRVGGEYRGSLVALKTPWTLGIELKCVQTRHCHSFNARWCALIFIQLGLFDILNVTSAKPSLG